MVKSTLCGFLLVLALIAVTVPPAAAQIQTGILSVKAVDDQGAVMPGVTVTVSSPILPTPLVGVTDASGVYQVPGLSPGSYVVRLELAGFQRVIREDVIVRQGQTAGIEVAMKIGGVSEEVTVKGESPVVDAKSVGARVNIDTALIESTPGGRDIWNVIEYKAPGVVVESPDVGGNQGGLQRSLSARGTGNAQNTQMLNGVNVNDPAAQGFAMYYYVPTTLENIQVSTGAQDIAVGTGGVFINMVTKGGTDRFRGMGLQTYQSRGTQSKNVDDALLQAGLRPDANSTELLTNTNAQVGGPLVKSKLFFFTTFNFQATHVRVPNFPAVVPTYIKSPLYGTSEQDTTEILAGEGKLTYQAGGHNRFEGFLAKQRYDKPNRGASNSNTQDSNSKELDTFLIEQVSHNVMLSDRMFLDSKVSYNNTHFPLHQKTDLQPINDNSTSILYQNRTSDQVMFRRRLQIVSNFQYYLPRFLGGRHEFKAGFDNGYTPEDVDTARVGDVSLAFTSANQTAATVQIFNTPLHQVRAVMSTAIYGQDTYTAKRITLTLGMRWERVEGYLPAQTAPESQFFPGGLVFRGVSINNVVQDFTVKKQFDAVRQNPLWNNWGPRASVTFDVTGKGRTVAKFSVGRYLDQINTGTPPNPNASINQTYVWNDLNRDWVFQKGNATWDGLKYVGGEFGAQQGSTGGLAVATFDKSVRRPYRTELTAGVEHELFKDLLVSVSYLRTREHDMTGNVDMNMALWDQLFTPITLTDPGRDGITGTGDDLPLVVYNQNQSGTVTSTQTINDDRLAARYDGVDLVVTKRMSRGWTVLAGYTYSRTRVDLTSLANPNAALVNAAGESGGRRHNLKFSGSYELPYKILAGANFRLQSGLPITRTWAIPSTLLRQGAVTVNAEPRGSVELPWLPTLDLRAGRLFGFGRTRLDLSVDIYNVTNANTTWGVRTTTGLTNIRVGGDPAAPVTQIPSFLSPTSILAPRVVRFNVRIDF